MFLRKEYRARAVGILAAYAVLGIGIVVSGGFATASETVQTPKPAVVAGSTMADDCSSPIHDRSDTLCYVC